MKNTYGNVIIFPKTAMIGTGESVLPGGMRNIYFQLFGLQIHFPLTEHHKYEFFSQPLWDIQV